MTSNPNQDSRGDEDSGADATGLPRLLRSAMDGDPEAISQVVEGLRPYLLLIANQDLDADLHAKLGPSDLVQSTLLAAQQNFQRFHGSDMASLRGWVKKILRNNLLDARRRYKQASQRRVDVEVRLDDRQQSPLPTLDSRETPSRLSSRAEQAEMLERALAELPERYRLVIRLRNWQELGFREIGQQMDIGEDAARKLWSRAIVQLQQVIATRFPDLDSTASDWEDGDQA